MKISVNRWVEFASTGPAPTAVHITGEIEEGTTVEVSVGSLSGIEELRTAARMALMFMNDHRCGELAVSGGIVMALEAAISKVESGA